MGVSTVINDVSFLTYYGISRHLLQALWLIANLLPSLPRLPGYHLYMLMNKLSQLALTSEVATAPTLKAAIHSSDVCPESAAPCSKAAPHWHRWATGTLRIVLIPSCKALLLAPSLEVDLLLSCCAFYSGHLLLWPGSMLYWVTAALHWIQVTHWLLQLCHTPTLFPK